MAEQEWESYLSSFHSERAGITENVLEHVRDASGRTPYAWAAEPIASSGTVLDLACGSAPMAARLAHAIYVGLDLSRAELAEAAAKSLPVAQADAARLPLGDSSVDAVVMSMALMLVPLQPTLAEIRRVLRPGGVFVATVPHNRPLPAGDWLRYARLCLALRHLGLAYPNDEELSDAAGAFGRAGLDLQDVAERGFCCRIASPQVADRVLASLYLPEVPPERLAAGRRVVTRWTGSDITMPIRRFVARAQPRASVLRAA